MRKCSLSRAWLWIGLLMSLSTIVSCATGVAEPEDRVPEKFRGGIPGLELLARTAASPDYPFPRLEQSKLLPSQVPLQDYEQLLYYFLNERVYADPKAKWAFDREVRNTGPFVLRTNYGTHGIVRIYYSPGVLEWLVRGREGEIPDGAMIIKEQLAAPEVDGASPPVPAAYWNEFNRQLREQYPENPRAVRELFQTIVESDLSSWAVMVRDKSVSSAGWFWANPGRESMAKNSYGKGPYPPGVYPVDQGQEIVDLGVDDPVNRSSFPNSRAGQGTCLRCHGSAASHSTFSSLTNIAGFESAGQPLQFRVDNDWRQGLPPAPVFVDNPSQPGELPLPPGLDLPHPPHLTSLNLSKEELPGGGQSEGQLIANYFQHLPTSEQPVAALAQETIHHRTEPSEDWERFFPKLAPLDTSFPGQWADHVPSPPENPEHFITSDNCLGCHGGLGGAPSGVTMFLKTGPAYGDGYNISEFGEWRWSPMGLAGRDPIFFAQLESEFALLEKDAAEGLFPEKDLAEIQQAVANTCLSCHAAMGQRQLALDYKSGAPGIDSPNFELDYLHQSAPLTSEDPDSPYFKYGNLGREGISCTICHHINPPTQWSPGMESSDRLASFLLNSTTGVFPYSPADELNGPFADVRHLPMRNSMAIDPKLAPLVPAHPASPHAGTKVPYIQDSKMCGTCHSINLPNVDAPTDRPLSGLTASQQAILNQAARNGSTEGTNANPVPLSKLFLPYQHSIEQATYLEWENSGFAWDSDLFQSCQDCHMPGEFHSLDGKVNVKPLRTQIASIQDSNFPESDHSLTEEELDVPVRDNYRRHELVGLNAFLLEMFNQFDTVKSGTDEFDDALRVAKMDPETFAANGNRLAVENMVRSARQLTVDLDLELLSVEQDVAEVKVTVRNKVGHRFPSGVGFRRTFLEVVLWRGSEIVWASGRTDSAGVILGGDGKPLPSEKLPPGVYQPHYQKIDSQDQVQIYEELVVNAKGEFTTSFIHRDDHPKDNRLLPLGFLDPSSDEFAKRFGDGNEERSFEEIRAFMEATKPEGNATKDPDFRAGSDSILYEIPVPSSSGGEPTFVTATMYYQAIPPYWLNQRFSDAPDGPATRRLYYLTSLLNTSEYSEAGDPASGKVENPILNWKLKLVTKKVSIP